MRFYIVFTTLNGFSYCYRKTINAALRLKNKYSSYITSDDDESIMFDDKVSFIYLGHSYSNNLYDMGLIYADKKIDNQRKQADNQVPFCGFHYITY